MTIFASVRSGRPPLTGGCELEIVTDLSLSSIVTWNFSIAAAVLADPGSIELGRMVTTGVPTLTFALAVNHPPNTDWVVDRSLRKSTASVITPPPIRSASLPAISFPRADDATKTVSGFSFATT